MADGCAIGVERATDVAQLRNLSIPVATPLIVPVSADTKSRGTAGMIEVTGSFTQTGKVTVHPLGRLWHGVAPILKLAKNCVGTLDIANFELGVPLGKFRTPAAGDSKADWPKDLRLEVRDGEDGSQLLCLVSDMPGLLLIVR